MSFPSGPTNGQVATVNGISFTYNSTNKAWTRNTLVGSIGGPVTVANLTCSGLTTLTQTTELASNIAYTANTTIVHNFNNAALFSYSGNITGNYTANFINLPTVNNSMTVVGMLLNQSSTPGYANVVQISGTPVTILWSNGSAPTPNANKHEVQSLSLFYNGSTYTVYGQYSSFG